jgi:broad specificity phosphatase PhoE
VTTFYLIRHAQRAGDQSMLAGRIPGLSLTVTGREESERLARRLSREPITQIVSSPIERALQTAEPLARILGLTVAICPAMTEIDSGSWTGRTFRELDASDVQWRQFNRMRGLTPIPGGESMVEVQARFVGEMLRLRELYPNDAIACVSHADPIKVALACFLGAPLDFYDRLEVGLGSVSVVTMDEGGPKVLRLNEAAPAISARA